MISGINQMRLHWLAAAAVFSLASIGSASAAVYGEDFNDSSFKGSTAVNVSDETDHWASAGLYTINNADGWTFTGSAGLYVNNSGPFDGALLLNECCIENGQGAQASAAVDNLTVGGAYKVSFLEWGDNAPGGTYTLYSQIGSSTPFSYNGVDGAAGSNVSGNSLSYDFVATSTSENLLFYQGNSVGGASPIIDNISISAVPEPATWGMLLFGLFGLGAMLRSARRKRLAGAVAA
jgi:hypothetical protein